MKFGKLLAACVLAAAVSAAGAGAAFAEDMPAAFQAAIIVKIFNQEKGLSAKETVKLALVCADASACSALSDEFAKLRAAGSAKNLEWYKSSADKFENEGADAVYLALPGEEAVSLAVKASQRAKTLSITGRNAEEAAAKGVSVGLDIYGGKPRILVNLNSIVKEGKEFTLQFLTLVKVVGK